MKKRLLTSIVVCYAIGVATAANGQTQFDWNVPGPANWNVNGNWSLGAVPEAQFGDFAVIANGGTAFVQDSPPAVGSVQLGDGIDTAGTLEIRSGGNLDISGTPLFPGHLIVGDGANALGTLRILSGGAVTAAFVESGGSDNSLIDLSGTASLTSMGGMVLGRRTRLRGPDVAVNVTGGVVLANSSVLVAEITDASHSSIDATNSAFLAGDLEVQFDGVAPSVGNTWDLVTAASITGQFADITVSGAGTLGPGQAFRTRTVDSGGSQTHQLLFDQILTLTIDRASGSATINNLGGTPISLDGYRITSASGALSDTAWSSFQDQALADWQEANPTTNQLAELRQTGTTPIGGMSASTSLGNVFSPNPAAFGDETEDLVFEFSKPGETNIRGFVEYTGEKAHNNFVLRVDPTTGEAQVTNESQFFTATIDGYRIRSATGALTPGTWTSFEDQAVSDWQESNPSPGQLAELNMTDSTLFGLNSSTRFNLGTIFNTAGAQDLVFEYLFPGVSDARLGVVEYGPLDVGLAGDFDNDGDVDGRDFLVWQRNPGIGNLSDWQSNYGAPLQAAVVGVPEPATASLACIIVFGFVAGAGQIGLGRRNDII